MAVDPTSKLFLVTPEVSKSQTLKDYLGGLYEPERVIITYLDPKGEHTYPYIFRTRTRFACKDTYWYVDFVGKTHKINSKTYEEKLLHPRCGWLTIHKYVYQGVLKKKRGATFVYSQYCKVLDGLCKLQLNFENKNDAELYRPPESLRLREVTGDLRYTDKNIAELKATVW